MFKKFLEEKGIEDITKLSADEQAQLYNEFNEAEKARLEKMVADKASKEDIEAVKTELAEVTQKQFEALNSALKTQGLALKRLTSEEANASKNWRESLKSDLVAKKAELEGLKESRMLGFPVKMTVKAPGTMTIAGNVSGGNVPVEDRIEGLNRIPSRQIRLLDVMSKRSTMSNVVSWVYQANQDGTAGQTGEGLAKNQIDFDLVVGSESIKKTTAYIKVSTEMLDDIDFIQSEIEAELLQELLKAVEAQAYEGDGTGNNLNGIRTVSSAFAPGAAWTGQVDNANVIDVLVAASDQIEVADQPTPDFVFMHPTDVNKLKVEKVSSTDKRYIERLSMVAGELLLDGVTRIVKSTLVTQDEY